MNAPEVQPADGLQKLVGNEWHRLAPAAIVHFMVKFVLGVAKNGIQNVAYLGGIAVFTGDNRWWILGLIASGALITLIVSGVLSYLSFKFRMEGQSFLIKRGVLNKKRLTLSFDRIQNVAIKEPIYFRPFGLVALGLESAGSSDEEISLAGIPRTLAEQIRTTVLQKPAAPAKAKVTTTETGAEAHPSQETEELLLAQPISELVRYGLSNNNIWVIAGLATGAFFQQAEAWEGAVEDFVRSSVIPVVGDSPVILGSLLGGVVLFVILFLMTLSVLGAIIIHFNFRLTFADGRYHRTKGLFERQETSVPESKIQSLQINQPWPALLLKRWHITIKQVGFGKTEHEPGSQRPSFIIPSVTPKFFRPFAERLLGPIDWGTQLSRVSKRYVWTSFLYWFLPPMVIASLIIGYFTGTKGFVFPFVFSLVILPTLILRHRRFGYWTNGKTALVRSGLIGNQTSAFAFRKVQTVILKQSPSQRRRDLATLTIQLAGQTLTIPFMPLEDAAYWRDQILYEAETSKQAWM